MYCLGKSFVSYKISNIRMIRYGRFRLFRSIESIPVFSYEYPSDDPAGNSIHFSERQNCRLNQPLRFFLGGIRPGTPGPPALDDICLPVLLQMRPGDSKPGPADGHRSKDHFAFPTRLQCSKIPDSDNSSYLQYQKLISSGMSRVIGTVA